MDTAVERWHPQTSGIGLLGQGDGTAVSDITTRVCFTVEEAAEMLGISRAHAYNLVSDGTIRSVKLGRSRRIPADALSELMVSDVA